MGRLTARRWLITGVSSGLGRALAEAALARGDHVAGTLRRQSDSDAFEGIAPTRTHPIIIDLTETRRLAAMVDDAARALGGLDIVVNNAGYALAGAVEETDLDEARAQFDVNFYAPLEIARASLPHLRHAGGGRIINISSMAALEAYRGLGLYCASKAALSLLSEALAIEARPFDVRVTCVEAAGFRTNFAGSSLKIAGGSLPEYGAMYEEMLSAFARSNGNQRNDPRWGAAALLALVDLPDPPVHYALGDKAHARIERLLAAREKEYAAFASLGPAQGSRI